MLCTSNIKNLLLTHSGPFCPRHGTISLQWSQHDRVPYPQHGKLSGVVDHREVVNGAATSPTQTWLRPVGWIHDGRQKTFLILLMLAHILCCVCENIRTVVFHLCTSKWPNPSEGICNVTAPLRVSCCTHSCFLRWIVTKLDVIEICYSFREEWMTGSCQSQLR